MLKHLCAVSITVLAAACSRSTGPAKDKEGEPVASETIGTAGGTVAAQDISLTVPAGAFGTNTVVSLAEAAETPFAEEGVSKTYAIEGIPETYGDELTVSLAYEGDLTETSYIAVGMETFVSSLQRQVTTYSLLPATVDGDRLTCVLPAGATGAAKQANRTDDTTGITVTAVTGYQPHVTPGGHFKMEYASRWTALSAVQQLGQYLEEAYSTIHGLGFSYDARTNWPVSVTVKNLDSEVSGYSSNSLWGDNYGYLEFNAKQLGELAEVRGTAGHEFFHLVQSLYDPRNRFSKAKFASPHLWLDEACAVWVEEKFSDQADYVSPVRAGNTMAPFSGIVAGASEDAAKHGYGLSAMIKYLVGEYGEECLVNAYKKIKGGSHAVSALVSSTYEPSEWWETFLRKYTMGEIYNAGLSELVANRSGMFQIVAETDTLATFSAAYADLSGRLYVVRLDDPYVDENAKVECRVSGGMGEVSVLKYNVQLSQISFLGTSSESVTVTDIRNLTESGWELLVLVSNSRSVSPFTDTTGSLLEIRVVKKPELPYTHCIVNVTVYGHYQSTTLGDFDKLHFFTWEWDGSFEDSTFTAEWDTVKSGWGENRYTGNITVTLDANAEKVISLSASDVLTKETYTLTNTISGKDIPKKDLGWWYLGFGVSGEETRTHITDLVYRHEAPGESYLEKLDSFECSTEHSTEYSLEIRFREETFW